RRRRPAAGDSPEPGDPPGGLEGVRRRHPLPALRRRLVANRASGQRRRQAGNAAATLVADLRRLPQRHLPRPSRHRPRPPQAHERADPGARPRGTPPSSPNGGPPPTEPMRIVESFVVNPSEDLAIVARHLSHRMPRLLRYLLEGLGTPDAQSADLMSYLLFDSKYTGALVDIGYRD